MGDSITLLGTLIIMGLMVHLSFVRGRTEAAKVSVNAAELLALYRDAQEQLNNMRTHFDKEKADLLRELYKVQVKLQVYEERMKMAGIDLEIEPHARLHIAVYDLIVGHMNMNDLRTAVFYMNMSWDTIEGDNLPSRAQSLVAQLEREGKMEAFLHEMKRRFPHVHWPITDSKGRMRNEPPPPAEPETKRPSNRSI